MLDSPLEAFNEEMAHGLLLCPWSPNPDHLDNVETDHHLPQVVTDDMSVTTGRVPVLDHDNRALDPGVGKGPSVLHINKMPVVLRFFIILGWPPLIHIPHPLYSPDLIIQSTPSSRDLILSIHDIIHDIMTHQA
jgi:hypothetical protein